MEDNVDVEPEVMDYPTENSIGKNEKPELRFIFVHSGLPSPPILFLSRGSRLCHRSPTNCVGG